MNTNIKHTALLSRLSREDENIGTSESILTQKTMLTQYAKSHHLKILYIMWMTDIVGQILKDQIFND